MILKFLKDMLPYMLLAVPAIIVWRTIAAYIISKQGKVTTLYHEVGLALFVIFLVGLASQTIVPESSIMDTNSFNINMIPFKGINTAYRDIIYNGSLDYLMISIIGNIVIFMPIGIFVPLLYKAACSKVCIIGFCSSLFIELCQMPLSRWTDIDDLWLNTLGVFLGYIIYVFLRNRFPIFVKRFRLK